MRVGTEAGQGGINRTGKATRTKLTLMMEGTLETHQPHWLTQILYFGEYVTEITATPPHFSTNTSTMRSTKTIKTHARKTK